uniref:beta-1,3-galactosyltransferase 5-like n=1 Tax=Myxine glutinosa TaxID=7769 RepID=UPI00358FF2AF
MAPQSAFTCGSSFHLYSNVIGKKVFGRRVGCCCFPLLLGIALHVVIFLTSDAFEEFLTSYIISAYPVGHVISTNTPTDDTLPWPPSTLFSPSSCLSGSHSPRLLVLVTCAPSHAAARMAIRESWGLSSHGNMVRFVFVLGLSWSSAEQRGLEDERVLYGDVLQASFHDTYRNLTLKTMAGLKWALSACPDVAFILKVDDDVFVNIPALLETLIGIEDGDFYVGRIHFGVRPVRTPSHKYFDQVYKFERYPPYCSGTAYALSTEAAKKIMTVALSKAVYLLPMEDVFIGMCAQVANLKPSHNARFAGGKSIPAWRYCYQHALTAHHVSPGEMRQAWRSVEHGSPCFALFRPYIHFGCSVMSLVENIEKHLGFLNADS